MSINAFIANAIRIASEDLAGARILALSNNRNAVYLCEQAAEKAIRAVLTSEGKHAGIRHQLDEMVDQIPDENPLKTALMGITELATLQPPTAIRPRLDGFPLHQTKRSFWT